MSCEDEDHGHNHGGSGGGHGHGQANGHAHGHSHIAPVPTNASQSLLSKIDTPHVTALNMANEKDELQDIFRKPEKKYELTPILKSDADSQLIINIPFLNGSVKLFSIILRTNGDKYCPRTIKLFKNDRSIDFDNVNDKRPHYKFEHPKVGVMYNDDEDIFPETLENDDEFVEHFLPRSVFTGVQQLTIFIEDIWDEMEEDESNVHYIELRGEFTELSKDPVITLYESAANPADHKNLTATEFSNYSMGN